MKAVSCFLRHASTAFLTWGSVFLALAALPRESTSQDEPVRRGMEVAVHCIDADGNPIEGAEVYLLQHNGQPEGAYITTGPFRSDEDGFAVCDQSISRPSGTYDRWLYARVPGKLVGVGRAAQFREREPFNEEHQVRLFPSQSVKGRVKVPEGYPPEDVKVIVRVLHAFHGNEMFDFESLPREPSFRGIDTALRDRFETTPNSDGQFEFNDIPVHGRLYLVTRAPGLAEAQWRNEGRHFLNAANLVLEPEAVLKGQVLAPDGQPAEGIEVTVRRATGDSVYLSSFTTMTDDKGHYQLKGLPGIQCSIMLSDPQERWVIAPVTAQQFKSGEIIELDWSVETGVTVAGQVVDDQGSPVAAAHLSALVDDDSSTGLANASTDDEGRFEMRLPSGKAKLYFNSLPDGFVYPNPQIVHRLEIKKGDVNVAPVELQLSRQ